MKEMATRLMRRPDKVPSSEAAHIALLFANIAWNECVGLDHARDNYRIIWEAIEVSNPELWNEFKSNDIDGMVDELVRYKKQHLPDDLRRILSCGIPDGKVRVEWIPPVALGVDSKWEMQLYGLVMTGEPKKAAEFLRTTRGMSRVDAAKRVAEVATELGC